MPAEIFSEHQDKLGYEVHGGDRTKFKTASELIIVKRAINRSRELIYEFAHWPWSKQRGYIITTASYSTGTVTVTVDLNTITGVGTTWTVAMEGRYFIHGSVAYKIRKFVSTTSLILEVPYTGSTASGESYYICDAEYTLPYYVREITAKTVVLIGQDKKMSFISEQDFADGYANPSSVDDPPTKYRLPGYADSAFYSTGTITTNGTVNIAGVDTAWDHTMIGRAFRRAGESEIYRISDVTSTTALVLDRIYGGADGSGLSYEIDPGPCLEIAFYPFFTKSRGIQYWYWTKPDPLINDADIDRLMPGDFHEGVDLGAEWIWYEYEKAGGSDAQNAQQKFFGWLQSQKKKQRLTQDKRTGIKPHSDFVS